MPAASDAAPAHVRSKHRERDPAAAEAAAEPAKPEKRRKSKGAERAAPLEQEAVAADLDTSQPAEDSPPSPAASEDAALPSLAPPDRTAVGPRAVQAGLPSWFTSPVRVDADVAHTAPMPACLDPNLVSALCANGIDTLFPIQAAVVPAIVGGFAAGMHPGDMCVCAPTGSGKTLAYVLPILQCLSSRVVCRLRAVVVLPTRELAQQVKAVFDAYLPSINAARRRDPVQVCAPRPYCGAQLRCRSAWRPRLCRWARSSGSWWAQPWWADRCSAASTFL